MVPIDGLDGLAGCAFIVTAVEGADEHPAWFRTVNVYVPDGTNVIVVVVPVPLIDTFPGARVTDHVPEGNPLRTTLPVGTEHVG